MFRSLYENFTDGAGGGSRPLANYFQYSVPGRVLTTDAGMNIVNSGDNAKRLQAATDMASLGRYGEQTVQNLATRFQSGDLSPEIMEAQARCEKADIDSVIGTMDGSATFRCGWLYEKPAPGTLEPRVSKGWLGTMNGPLDLFTSKPDGKWYWDVNAAKQQILTDKCANVTRCEHLGSEAFRGVCGFCQTTGRGIPVNSRGEPMYQGTIATQCAPSKVIADVNKCPRPTPAPVAPLPPGAPPPRVYDVCEPLPGDRLRKDCLIQQAKLAGCEPDGALITALQENTNPNDYITNLRQQNAFVTYQNRAPIKLNEGALRDGRTTIAAALDNFRGLASAANVTTESALNYAAHDLCKARGTLDSFDFCVEISDSAPPPFALDCLQKEFKRAGGQPAGRKYPRASNLADFQAFPNYGAYKLFLKQLRANCDSRDVSVQEAALADLFGIRRENIDRVKLNRIPAFEQFVFNASDTIFQGRRVRDAESGLTRVNWTVTAIPGVEGNIDFASFVLLTDLRPPKEENIRLMANTDDGIAITINKDMTNYDTTQRISDLGDDFRRNNPQVAFVKNNACTKLKAGGGNIAKIYWNNVGGGAEFRMRYEACGAIDGPYNYVPSAWISMTQEYKAPALAFEVAGSTFAERRMPEFFPVESTNTFTETRKTNLRRVPGERPFLNFTGPSSSLTIKKLFSRNAFSTISLAFRINRPVIGTERIMVFGNIEVAARVTGGSGTEVVVIVNDNKGTVLNSIPVAIKTGSFYVLNMEIGSQAGSPLNTLMIGVYEAEALLGGAVSTEDPDKTGVIRAPYSYIHLPSAPTGAFVLGKVNGVAGSCAGMDVAYLHLFDYSLTSEDIKKDIANKFERIWY